MKEQTLRIQPGQQLEETTTKKKNKQLAHQKRQEELLVTKEKETTSELQTLKVSLQEIQQRNKTELRAEKQQHETIISLLLKRCQSARCRG